MIKMILFMIMILITFSITVVLLINFIRLAVRIIKRIDSKKIK